jgi:short-subunit dehydrogenase
MKRVLILGATSAVATEVAVRFASQGARLFLVGRNAVKLETVAVRCAAAPGAAGAPVTRQADFTQTAANQALLDDVVATLGAVDIALVAHGDLGDQLASEGDFTHAAQTFHTNLLSVVSLVVPLANHMERAGQGTLGVITSVAADRGRPRNYTYGAAKGALNVYLEGLRSRLYPRGVKVTTIKLGPVDSPMTHDHEKTRVFSTPQAVAPVLVEALLRGTPVVYAPRFWRFFMPIIQRLPEPVFQRFSFLAGR